MINQIGRYQVISELGQGAMGMVYKAVDPLIEREVAIKTISLNIGAEEREEYEQRFYQEAKAAGKLSHPNIVTIYDVGKSGDIAYIAMEFLQGQELRNLMNTTRLTVKQALEMVVPVALGLAYAHEHGVVHRDVKPSNVMILSDGHVKITDFGIARMSSSSVKTQVGMVLGSPKYMSPEQVLGKSIDNRSDIFSLGVMLYELLTGKPPFYGDSVNAIMYQILNTQPAKPSSLNPDIPDIVDAVVAKALAKRTDGRYQNVKSLAADLKICLENLGGANKTLTPEVATPVAPIPTATPVAEQAADKTQKISNKAALEDEHSKTMRLDTRKTAPSNKVDKPEPRRVAPVTPPADTAAPSPRPKIPPAALIAGGVLLLLVIAFVIFGA